MNPEREAWTAHKKGGAGNTRRKLMDRDGPDCHYCGLPLKDDQTIEHVVPRAFNGPWHLDNLVLAHERCNGDRASYNAPHPGCDFCAAARAKYPASKRPKSGELPPLIPGYWIKDNRGWRDDVYPGYRLVNYDPAAFAVGLPCDMGTGRVHPDQPDRHDDPDLSLDYPP